jgi:hypothetical protein
MLLVVSAGCLGFRDLPKHRSAVDEARCQDKWRYTDFNRPFTGKVLFHATTRVLCGRVATASVTLLKTSNADTARVLELCNLVKHFATGATVTVQPAQAPGFRVDLIPADPSVCALKATCFGTVELTE